MCVRERERMSVKITYLAADDALSESPIHCSVLANNVFLLFQLESVSISTECRHGRDPLPVRDGGSGK